MCNLTFVSYYCAMTPLQSLILGIIQGLTEFLPVSSSGHLALAEHLFGLRIPPAQLQSFDVVLHAGSLLALFFWYFGVWRDLGVGVLRREPTQLRLLGYIVIATVPGAVAGLFLEDWLAEVFRGQWALGITFAITGAVLLLADFLSRFDAKTEMTSRRAFFIGLAQMCALPAAISRSGMTIAMGQMLGFSRKQALDFSFLIAFPIIAGAVGVTTLKVFLGEVTLPAWQVWLPGFLASLVCSVLAVMWLRRFVRHFALSWFVPYIFLVAVVSVMF